MSHPRSDRAQCRSRMRLVGLVAVAAIVAVSGCTSAEPAPTTTSTTEPTSTTSTVVASTSTTTTSVPLRLAVVGDTGTGLAPQYQVAALITIEDLQTNFDHLVLLGDMIYEVGEAERIDEVVFDPYTHVLENGTGLVPVLGNHDVISGQDDQIMAELGAPGRWYTVETRDLLLIVLDSTRPNDAEQLAFLDTALSGAQGRWIIAAFHHPPYSAGAHGSDPLIQDTFVPLFRNHQVDLVLSGHDHDYQRSNPIDGVTYVVSGAGAKLRPTGAEPFTAVSSSELHFTIIEVTQGEIRIEAIGLLGTIDEHTIKR